MISPPSFVVWLVSIVFFAAGLTSFAVAGVSYYLQKRPWPIPVMMALAGVVNVVFAHKYAQLTIPGYPGNPIPSAEGRAALAFIAIAALVYPLSVYFHNDREFRMTLEHAEKMEAKQRVTQNETAVLQRHIARLIEQNTEQQKLFQEFRYLILTNVGHELRTPLTFILGFLSMIIGGTFGAVAGTSLEEPLETVHAGARRILAIVQRMLVATLREPIFESVDIADIGRQAVADRDIWLNTRRNREDVTITYDIPEKLLMIGDAGMLLAAVVELLNNAIKFGATAVHLAILTQDGEIIVQIKDNGIGVPREHHRDIFEPFFQVQMHSQRQYEGAGAGLAAVENVTRKHRGHVFVQNRTEGGAIFNLILPAKAGK